MKVQLFAIAVTIVILASLGEADNKRAEAEAGNKRAEVEAGNKRAEAEARNKRAEAGNKRAEAEEENKRAEAEIDTGAASIDGGGNWIHSAIATIISTIGL